MNDRKTIRSDLKKKNQTDSNTFITQSQLKDRGWTPKLIKEFAEEPDLTKPNPMYRSASPMKLYCLKRIKNIERRKKFKEEFEKAKIRKNRSQTIAENKRQRLLEHIEKLNIKIPIYDKDKLIDMACEQYNYWHSLNYDVFEFATKDSDKSFIKRICINFLRHRCTKYEYELDKMFGKVGVNEAHNILQNKINDKIKEQYEWLR